MADPITLPSDADHTGREFGYDELAYWKYPLIVDPAVIEGGADALGASLNARGVFCAPRYIQKPAFLCRVFTERKLPVYHTFAYFVSAQRFRRNLDALLRSGLPVFYGFHAADLLELVADGVDRRMDRHPGMGDSLARKRALLRETLQTITAARCVTTYRAAVEGGTWH